jgi:hypothetical protein
MAMDTLLIVQPLLIVLMIVFYLWFGWQMKKALRYQDSLVDEAMASGGLWHRVYINGEGRFRKIFKILAFESRGMLIDAGDSLRILGHLPNGQRLDQTFEKKSLTLNWLGNHGLGSANMYWIELTPPVGESLVLAADTGINTLSSRQTTADLWRQIAPSRPLPDEARQDFALEKNPASLVAVILLLLLLVYAVLDGLFLNDKEALDWGSSLWGLTIGFLLPIPAWMLLSRARVPTRESLVLAMFCSLALEAAYFPAIKRIDEALARDGVQEYAYRQKENSRFEPVTEGMPVILFGNRKAYWQQFAVGSTHTFAMVRGPLGIWQLDHSKLAPKMRAFYQNR